MSYFVKIFSFDVNQLIKIFEKKYRINSVTSLPLTMLNIIINQ